MAAPSARRRERVGGRQTNMLESARTTARSRRTYTATKDLVDTPPHGTLTAPPVYGRNNDGSYNSSKGMVTVLDRQSPLSARTKMGIMASLHAEKGILQPIWPRVTTTPFHCRHQVLQGNGRELHGCSVSFEAPDHFHIPQVMQHRYHPFKGTFTDVKIHHGALAVGSTAESPDLPPYLRVSGIDAFWNKYNRRKGNPHHRVIFFKNQALFEPNVPETPRPQLWGPDPAPPTQRSSRDP